jgi:hypothetical protein
MKRFHNTPDKRALSVTVLRAVCSPDVRAEAPTEPREKTDRYRQGCVQNEGGMRPLLFVGQQRVAELARAKQLNPVRLKIT